MGEVYLKDLKAYIIEGNKSGLLQMSLYFKEILRREPSVASRHLPFQGRKFCRELDFSIFEAPSQIPLLSLCCYKQKNCDIIKKALI